MPSRSFADRCARCVKVFSPLHSGTRAGFDDGPYVSQISLDEFAPEA